ncbi:Leucine rich repeat protein [Entamoeba marina]
MFSWFKSTPQKPQPPQSQPNSQKNVDQPIELTTFHENWSINELKDEDFQHIFQYLSLPDLFSCRLVCKKWKTTLEDLPSLSLTEPLPHISSVFKNVKRLIVDPYASLDAGPLVTRLSNLTALRCTNISQEYIDMLYTLKELDCPKVIPPTSVQQLSTSNIEGIEKYKSLINLEVFDINDDELNQLSKLTKLRQLTINSKHLSCKIESLIDVSHLTAIHIINAPLKPEFFYNLYIFPYLTIASFKRCKLPVSGISPLTPLSQLSPSDGFIYIAGCNSLRYLSLEDSPLTDYHLDVVGRIETLRGLSLRGSSSLTDYMLQPFKKGNIQDSLEELNLSDTMITHVGLQIIGKFKYLRVLDLSGCDGIRILSPLNSLKNLEILRMFGIKINADVLQDAFRVPPKLLQQLLIDTTPINDPLVFVICSKFLNLVHLDLEKSQITSEGVSSLELLTSLRVLNLNSTPIDDTAFESLANVTSLEIITMNNCPNISASNCHLLEPLQGLRVLSLNGCINVDDYSIKSMHDLTIETLRLSNCVKLGALAWKYIAMIESLRRLDISYTDIGDECVDDIENCKLLEVVFANHTKVTLTTLNALLKCKLIRKIDLRETDITDYQNVNCIILTTNPQIQATTKPTQESIVLDESTSDSTTSSSDDDNN